MEEPPKEPVNQEQQDLDNKEELPEEEEVASDDLPGRIAKGNYKDPLLF